MRTLHPSLLLAGIFAAASFSAQAHDPDRSRALSRFASNENVIVSQVHAINSAEIQAAQDAQQRSVDGDVRGFAAHMIEAHSQADLDVQALAQKKSFTVLAALPAETDEARDNVRDDATLAQLTTLNGSDFDRAYMDFNVKGHQKAFKKLALYRKRTSDADLKALLGTLSREVAEHLREARRVQAKVNSAESVPPLAR